jgi:hypothetical protein
MGFNWTFKGLKIKQRLGICMYFYKKDIVKEKRYISYKHLKLLLVLLFCDLLLFIILVSIE